MINAGGRRPPPRTRLFLEISVACSISKGGYGAVETTKPKCCTWRKCLRATARMKAEGRRRKYEEQGRISSFCARDTLVQVASMHFKARSGEKLADVKL